MNWSSDCDPDLVSQQIFPVERFSQLFCSCLPCRVSAVLLLRSTMGQILLFVWNKSLPLCSTTLPLIKHSCCIWVFPPGYTGISTCISLQTVCCSPELLACFASLCFNSVLTVAECVAENCAVFGFELAETHTDCARPLPPSPGATEGNVTLLLTDITNLCPLCCSSVYNKSQ